MSIEEHFARAKRPPLETQVKRFAKAYRKRLRKLARTSPRLGDLLFSFPAAVFAIVSGHGDPRARGEAVALAKEGASLRRVATALGLPGWLRALPPEAFETELPATLAPDPIFDRKIVNLIPKAPAANGVWLELVLTALAADRDFAYWLAGQDPLRRPREPEHQGELRPVELRLLASYYWASRHSEALPGKFLDLAWHKRMHLAQAVHQAQTWFERAVGQFCRRESMDVGSWLTPQRVGGFSFSPRVSAAELAREGEVMNNCVGTYAERVARGSCLIYALRRGGRSVATMEIVPSKRAKSGARIGQLEGHGNGPPPERAVRAAENWLARQGPCPLFTRDLRAQLVDPDRWSRLWAPIWNAYGPAYGPPEHPTVDAFVAVEREFDQLARLSRA